jgi:hypothetical protein
MSDHRAKAPSPTAGGVAQRKKAADRSVPGNVDRAPSDKILNDDELIDEASQDSFPASDPPSFMAVTKPGTPRN